MISWQGSAPLYERLAPYVTLFGRMAWRAAVMLGISTVFNVATLAIWRGDARVVTSPLGVAWLLFYLMLLQGLLTRQSYDPAPTRPGLLIMGVITLPIAAVSLAVVEPWVLWGHVMLAQLISGVFR